MTKQEAASRLTNRYIEQTALFPALTQYVSLELYIQRNLKSVLENAEYREQNGLPDALADYK